MKPIRLFEERMKYAAQGGYASKRFAASLRLILTVAVASLASTVNAESLLLFKDMGDWKIEINTASDNSCHAIAVYTGKSGDNILSLGHNTMTGDIYLYVREEGWDTIFPDDGVHKFQIFLDDSGWEIGAAVVGGENAAAFISLGPLGSEQANMLLTALRKSNRLVVGYDEKFIAQFSLRGTFAAGAAFQECTEYAKSMNSDTSTSDIVGSKQSLEFNQDHSTVDGDNNSTVLSRNDELSCEIAAGALGGSASGLESYASTIGKSNQKFHRSQLLAKRDRNYSDIKKARFNVAAEYYRNKFNYLLEQLDAGLGYRSISDEELMNECREEIVRALSTNPGATKRHLGLPPS